MANEIISRKDAIAQGLRRYFTGDPCTKGHLAERRVSTFGCLVCSAENRKRWRVENPDKAHEKDRRDREKDPERTKEQRARYRERHRDKCNQKTRERRASPVYREEYLKRRRELRRSNHEKALAKDAEYRRKYREKARSGKRKAYWERRDFFLERSRKWREANSHILRLKRKEQKYWRIWRSNNLERARAYFREYYIRSDNKKAHIHNRRALKLAAGGKCTGAELAEILKAQRTRCAYCRTSLSKITRHLDHIMPLRLGGSNERRNLQWLCAPCNLSKSAKDPLVFAQERGLLL